MRKFTHLLLSLLLTVSLLSCNEQVNILESENDINITESADEVSGAVKLPEPEIIEQRTSFIGVGDNIIYGTKEARIHASGTNEQLDYKPYYAGVSELIKNADISFINQETLMCGDGYSLSYYPMFNSPQKVGIDLVELGFDVINISNNHMLDKGADGLSKTIGFWKSMDVLMIGGYENAEDYENIRVYEKDGLKIAFLSYCEMTNGLIKSASSPIVIPYLSKDDIVRQTEEARKLADLIFVSVHWGDEGSFTPNQTQVDYSKLFADCGVDVILGHHPHVIQPVEWIEGENGNKTLCVYSLGNFMAQQDRDYNMVGGMISFDIVHSENTRPRLENVIYSPTVFHFNGSFTENNVYLFEDYSPEMAQNHGVRRYYGRAFSYDRLEDYIRSTIDSQFLPDFFSNSAAEQG